MTIEENEQLLSVLLRTGIFGPDQAEEVRQELVPRYAHPYELGQYLVEIGWLTSYQLQMLLTGHWEDVILGSYQVLDRLGEGGVSEVLKAWDGHRGQIVALKVLRNHLAAHTGMVRQFQREWQAITRLSHPNIIKTFDAASEGDRHFFAMEFVEGMDLDRFTQLTGPLPVDMACDFARQVAQGLQHAHQAGLVHRDVKPANLFLLHPPLAPTPGAPVRRGADPLVKIIDWGLARCLRRPQPPEGAPATSDSTLEEKGRLIGTADYIAPEQAQDATLVDIRADIYSLGCTLYFLLTGHPPFPGSTLMQKLLQHQKAEPASLRTERPDVPEELDALVLRMLAKRPEDRPQIPLLVVTPLRRFTVSCGGANGRPGPGAGANGALYRPQSSSSLHTPGAGPGTTVNMPRPQTHATLSRPGATPAPMPRPRTSDNLPRTGLNGHDNGSRNP